MNNFQRCTRCVMDNKSDKSIKFDSDGYCNYCTDALKKMDEVYFPNSEGERRLKILIDRLKEEKKEKRGSSLTVTECEILKLMALGKTTKEIAAERFLSVYTVMTHRKNIFRKLEVNNVYEATKYALRAGIVDAVEYYI